MAAEGPSAGLSDFMRGVSGSGGGGGGGGAGQSMDKLANEDIGEMVKEAPNKIAGWIAKLTDGIPGLEILSKLLPTNLGEVGVNAGMERGAVTDRKIMESPGLGTKGGVLANIGGALMKNPQISKGEAPTADPSSGGESLFDKIAGMVDPGNFPTFAMADIPNSMSGQFSPPQFSEPMPAPAVGAAMMA